MDLLVSNEARRLNLLAIYNMITVFDGELIQRHMNEIAR